MSCPCTCHTGPYAACDIPGGCGQLHRSESLPDPRALTGLGPRQVAAENPPRQRPVEPEPQARRPVTATRPDGACLTHWPPKPGQSWRWPDPGYKTCSTCYDRLHQYVSRFGVDVEGRPDNIPVLYEALDATPCRNGHGRRAPGFGSRSPGSDHIITIRDPRSKSYEVARDGVEYVWDPEADNGHPPLQPGVYGPQRPPGAYVEKREVWFGSDGKAYREESDPARSVPHVLGSWTQLIAEERDIKPGTGDVGDLCVWLDRNLDWITRQDWVADLADDLRGLTRQLRAANGDGGSRPVGLCPNTIDEGVHTRACGANLFAPLRGDTIECQACGRKWLREEWLRLGDLLEAG